MGPQLGITSNILGRDGIYKIGGFCHSGEEFINFNTGEIVNGNTSVYFSINQEITDTFNTWWRLGYSPDKEKNIVGVIKEVYDKTGEQYDWMNALCISEVDMSMTFEFSESLREHWKRQRDEIKEETINYDK